jgi:osmoprotectant transport system permease protein
VTGFSLDPNIADAISRLPNYLSQHVLVSITALALGLAVSLPLALAAIHRPNLRWGLLAFASIIQTVPGLALLALFYPLLLGLAGVTERLLGAEFSAFGFLPSVLALSLYSMLPVLRNTLTAILGIEPALKQAARGVGMTQRQALFLVELPLAMPVIMAGIRTSAVWVIGTATLSTPIGQTSLGNYIFTGLQTQNWVFVLFGCFAAAILALVVDQMLAMVERGFSARRRSLVVAGAVGLACVLIAALWPGLTRSQASYVIGAKPFTEQYVLSALTQQRLQASGLSATRRDGLGSTVAFKALAAGEIDAYVDYSGTIWANYMNRSDTKSRDGMLGEVDSWLRERGILMLGALGFENAYVLAMPRKRAEELGIRSISDLTRIAPQLSIGGDYEFFGRPEWLSIRDGYDLRFRDERQMQSTFMYDAIAAGEIDIISAYSSDGRIALYDLVVLDDPKNAIPPYDAVMLISPKRTGDSNFIAALRPLINSIDVRLMRQANLRADRSEDRDTPDQAARWLWSQIAEPQTEPRK